MKRCEVLGMDAVPLESWRCATLLCMFTSNILSELHHLGLSFTWRWFDFFERLSDLSIYLGIYFINCFTLHVPAVAGGLGQQLGTPSWSPTWWQGPWDLGILCYLPWKDDQGAGLEVKELGLGPVMLWWLDACISGGSLTHCTTRPAPFRVLIAHIIGNWW